MSRARHVLSGHRLPVDNASLAIVVTALVGVATLIGVMLLVLPVHGSASKAEIPPPAPLLTSAQPGLTARQGLAGAPSPSVRISVKPSPTPTPSRSPSPTRSAPVTASYEAESVLNTTSGQTRPHNLNAASGGVVVGNIGRGSDNTLQMNAVFASAAGRYRVTVFYVSGELRTMTITVNGVSLGELSFASTSDFRTVGTLLVTMPLRDGDNTVEFENATGPAPDVDRIVVTA